VRKREGARSEEGGPKNSRSADGERAVTAGRRGAAPVTRVRVAVIRWFRSSYSVLDGYGGLGLVETALRAPPHRNGGEGGGFRGRVPG